MMIHNVHHALSVSTCRMSVWSSTLDLQCAVTASWPPSYFFVCWKLYWSRRLKILGWSGGAARNCASFSSVSLVTVTSHHIMGSALNWGFYCRHLLPNSRTHRMMYQFLNLSGARYFFMSLVWNLKGWVLGFFSVCIRNTILKVIFFFLTRPNLAEHVTGNCHKSTHYEICVKLGILLPTSPPKLTYTPYDVPISYPIWCQIFFHRSC